MFNRLKKKRREDETLKKLDEIINSIGKVLDEASEHKVQVIIQSLNIDKASLEQLTFKLDSLDIKELSGSLNLGNNFGTSSSHSQRDKATGKHMENQRDLPKGGPKSSNEQQDESTVPNVLEGGQKMEYTEKGYRIFF